ncbi:MAG: response regulator [Anaerolineales bacterium]
MTNALSDLTPLHVLIVDDNEDHARLAHEFLHLSGPFEADIAVDKADLWEHLATSRYDVIVLDYNLPDGNGLEALADIPKRGYRVPVIMVTGRGDERIAAQAIQRGAIEYIVKTGDYLSMLPAVIQKAVRTYGMMMEAQRSLEQIQYQALLLNNVRDAVVVWTLEGRISFWNRAAEALFGWRAAERLGQNAETVYLSAFTPPVRPPAAHGPEVSDVERLGKRNTGESIWVSSSVTTLYDRDGRLIGHMDVSRDITLRKKLEGQVQAAQAQLVQAARLAAIGELASGVAHQISNPLTTIIAETQLLRQNIPDSEAARESLEAIEHGGWRAQQAVRRLLDFSRPASATLESLSVNQTIENALGLIGGLIESIGVTLDVELSDALPIIHGNARQLEDLWVNLLLMARDATNDSSQSRLIRVCSLLNGHETVSVQVSDNGAPIPPDQLPAAFEPAFAGATIGRGTGMEPSICREIVRQHHGHISVSSVREQGTTFTIVFPLEVENDPTR